jgi:hypothetical protein
LLNTSQNKKEHRQPGVVVHTYNLTPGEAKIERWQIGSQLGPQNKILSEKETNKKELGMVVYDSNPSVGNGEEQRHEHHELKASLGYIVSSRPAQAT